MDLVDMLKNFASTFVGAGLVFYTNFFFLRCKRNNDQRTAGNFALATISRMYGDFVIAKSGIESDLKSARSNNPEIPLWCALQPTLFEFNAELHLDFKSLAFLVEDGNDTLFERLVDVETKYHELGRMLKRHSDSASQRIYKFCAAKWDNQTTSYDAEKQAGHALVGELDSVTKAIKLRVETHGPVYIKAGSELEVHIRMKFGAQTLLFRPLGAKRELSKIDSPTEHSPV